MCLEIGSEGRDAGEITEVLMKGVLELAAVAQKVLYLMV